MKGFIKTIFSGILIILLGNIVLFSLELPLLKGRVNDYADILTSQQEKSLEEIVRALEIKNSTQVVLLTIPSLKGENLENYALDVANKWEIGTRDYDNGVLLLVTMKERKIRIEVGYGLEHILTGLKCSYIIDHYLVPHFKRGNYFIGIRSGLRWITGLIAKEFKISDQQLLNYQKRRESGKKSSLTYGIITFIIMTIIGVLRGFFRRDAIRSDSGYRPRGFFWRSGGGSSGGFSGGGGSFGGGGASGGW